MMRHLATSTVVFLLLALTFSSHRANAKSLDYIGSTGDIEVFGNCEGDCDYDSVCGTGYRCFQLSKNGERVPGCKERRKRGTEFCYRRQSDSSGPSPTPSSKNPTPFLKIKGDNGSPSSVYPLKKCHGDCDRDSDCRGRLKCFDGSTRSNFPSSTEVPGCSGKVVKGKEYCYDPEDLNLSPIRVSGTVQRTRAKEPVTYVPGDAAVEENGLLLSRGLTARVIATQREKVEYANGGESEEKFHKNPDGGAVFNDEKTGGWIYVSNAESKNREYGGVGAITFNRDGEVVDYKMVLERTVKNCGGGKTFYNTWISCEETEGGQIWEVDPWGKKEARQTLMGGRKGNEYESAAYDNRNPEKPKFFITTDASEGPIVRYTPDKKAVSRALYKNEYSELLHSNETGTAERHFLVLEPRNSDRKDETGTFFWSDSLSDGERSSKRYSQNCEGIDHRDGLLYITCKEWQDLFILDLDNLTYNRQSTESGAFDGSPDQVTRVVGEGNDILYFCEEGGTSSGVHGRDAKGNFYTILESISSKYGETTGLAFSPDNKHMYVSFQDVGKIFDVTRKDGRPFGGKKLDIKYHSKRNRFEKP